MHNGSKKSFLSLDNVRRKPFKQIVSSYHLSFCCTVFIMHQSPYCISKGFSLCDTMIALS